MNAIPPAYRPRELGPSQRRWMERQGWVDRRKVKHACGCSPYLCEICNPRRKEPK